MTDVVEMDMSELTSLMFADEALEEARNPEVNGNTTDDWKPELKNEMGDEIDFNELVDDPIDSIELDEDEETDNDSRSLGDASQLEDDVYYAIDEREYAVDEIKTAVRSLDEVKNWTTEKEKFRNGMSTLSEYMDRSEFMGGKMLQETIDFWTDKMKSAKTNQEWEQAKYNKELNEARVASANAEYEKHKRELAQGKELQAQLEAQQIVNELMYAHGWKQEDFNQAVGYIQSNGIQIKPEQASAGLMMAIRKASMFDEKRKAKESELRSGSKVKPLVGSPVNSSNIDTITNQADTRARKAMKAMQEGKLNHQDMYSFLKD